MRSPYFLDGGQYFWTANYGWAVDVSQGASGKIIGEAHVRCVRGVSNIQNSSYSLVSDSIVYDQTTGLFWQRNTAD